MNDFLHSGKSRFIVYEIVTKLDWSLPDDKYGIKANLCFGLPASGNDSNFNGHATMFPSCVFDRLSRFTVAVS